MISKRKYEELLRIKYGMMAMDVLLEVVDSFGEREDVTKRHGKAVRRALDELTQQSEGGFTRLGAQTFDSDWALVGNHSHGKQVTKERH